MADIALRYYSPNLGSAPQYIDLKTGNAVKYSDVKYYQVADKAAVDSGAVQLPPQAAAKYDEIIRSDGGHAITAAPTKTSTADPRGMANNYGYAAKPPGMGLVSAVPGMGLIGAGANVAMNANNRAAVQTARSTLGFADKSNLGSLVSDNKGYVGDVTTGQNTNHPETTPVNFGGITADGRTAFTPNEARSRMLTNPNAAREATDEEVAAEKSNFDKAHPMSVADHVKSAFGVNVNRTPTSIDPSVNDTGMNTVGLNKDVTARSYVNTDGLSNTAKGVMNAMNDQETTAGHKMDVTSGYRSKAYNKGIGGAEESEHTTGNAFDVSMAGLSDAEKSAAVAHAVVAGTREIGTYSKDGSLHMGMISRNPDNTGIGVSAMMDRSEHNMQHAPGWFTAGLADVGKYAGVPTPTARPNIDASVANPTGVQGFAYAGDEQTADSTPALSRTEAGLTVAPGQTMAGEDKMASAPVGTTSGVAGAGTSNPSTATGFVDSAAGALNMASATALGAATNFAGPAAGFDKFGQVTNNADDVGAMGAIQANYNPGQQVDARGFYNKAYADARATGMTPTQAAVAAAQTSNETGYGQSIAGNNMFGIKPGSMYDGQTQNVDTHEEVNGVSGAVNDKFRAYDNQQQSYQDYKSFMDQHYPSMMQAQDLPSAIAGLDGYATDSHYQQKIGAIANKYSLDAETQYAGAVPSPRPDLETASWAPAPQEQPTAVAENPAPTNPGTDASTGYGFSSNPSAGTTSGVTGSGTSNGPSDDSNSSSSDSSGSSDSHGSSDSNSSSGGSYGGAGGFSSGPSSSDSGGSSSTGGSSSSGGGFANSRSDSSDSQGSPSGSDGSDSGASSGYGGSRSDGWN